MRMRNAVDIGIKYEKKVLEALQTYGLKAYTTIKTMFIPFRVMYVGLIGSVCL